MFLNRITNSLAFRSPLFYRSFLTASHVLCGKSLPNKANWNINFVLLCGPNNIPFLQQTLRSIYLNFESLPNIYIFTDAKLDEKNCSKATSWFPRNQIKITSAEACVAYHIEKGNNLLAKFAEQNPMGLKLAAIMQIADMGSPLVYCDTDVLWFKNPYSIINKILKTSRCNMHMSADFQPAYDKNLVEKGEIDEVMQAPYFCAGIMLIKRLSAYMLIEINKLLPIVSESSTHFSEQTLFAYLQKQCGPSELSADEFAIILKDQFSFKPLKNNIIVARHYIGPVRHLFWRDAFFLRVGKKP